MQVNYLGDVIHGKVGSHNVKATVTKLVDGKKTIECIQVGFDISDGKCYCSITTCTVTISPTHGLQLSCMR
jgi:hypothetical protein